MTYNQARTLAQETANKENTTCYIYRLRAGKDAFKVSSNHILIPSGVFSVHIKPEKKQ